MVIVLVRGMLRNCTLLKAITKRGWKLFLLANYKAVAHCALTGSPAVDALLLAGGAKAVADVVLCLQPMHAEVRSGQQNC